MEATIFFDESVYEDLIEIRRWYADQRVGLDSEFMLSFEASIQKIARNPELYPTVAMGSKAILLRRFPYRIFYKKYTERVVVFGVFHTKRSPSTIRKRLK